MIHVAMMSCALLGGALIDGIGPVAPLVAAAILLAVAAAYKGGIMRASGKSPLNSRKKHPPSE